MGTVGTAAAVGYLAYAGIKWLTALVLVPLTGGGSIVAAGVTP